MLLYRAFFLLKTIVEIRGEPIFNEKHFPASENHFLFFSCQKKQFFRIVETYTPAGENFFICLVERIFERILDSRYWGNIFLSNGDSYFSGKCFSTSGNRHKWKPIFKGRTYSCLWKLIFWPVDFIFFHSLIYFLRNPSS